MFVLKRMYLIYLCEYHNLAYNCVVRRKMILKNKEDNYQQKAIPMIDIRTSTKISVTGRIPMPQIGFGTYKFSKGSNDAFNAVCEAIKCGYRHIDTAFIYGGEETEIQVGKAIREFNCTVPRETLFITTKQWRSYHGYELTLKCLEMSLEKLQLTYIDLYLIHWPGLPLHQHSNTNPIDLIELRSQTWRAMEDALHQNKVRSIGVSNFTIAHLQALKKTAWIWPPAVNQIELHPYNYKFQKDLIDYCAQEGIAIQAYASLGGQDCGKKTWNRLGGKLLERTEVKAMKNKYKCGTEAQILLRWAMQHGFAVIPKTGNPNHMRSNLDACILNSSQRLSEGDMHLLDQGFVVMRKVDDDDTNDEEEEYSEDMLDVESKTSIISRSYDGKNIPNHSLQQSMSSRLTWTRDPHRMLEFD